MPRPRGSAKRVAWQTELMPEPLVLSVVPTRRQRSRGASGCTCGRDSSISSVIGFSSAANRSPAAAGSATPPRTTNSPPSTVSASSSAVPPSAFSRRLRRPRWSIVSAPGSAVASTIGARVSIAVPTASGSLPVSRQNDSVARPSRCSTRCGVSPSSRPMSAVDNAARCVSRSTLRCWSGRWCSASSTAFCSLSMPLSRCHRRATWRRWAIAQARGRTHSSGSGRRPTLRQWCRASTNASPTALRAAARSPVRA